MLIRLGLILLIVILFILLTRWSKVWSIVTAIGTLIIVIYIVMIVSGGIYQWQKDHSVISPKQLVTSFIQDVNPELNQKINRIREEITLADNKIQQLYDLKNTFPNQSQMIAQKIYHWQTLKSQLSQVSDNIDQKVEKAYVAYKIDEIQGKNKFSAISKELLKEANAVLANAEATKSVIEEQLL